MNCLWLNVFSTAAPGDRKLVQTGAVLKYTSLYLTCFTRLCCSVIMNQTCSASSCVKILTMLS